MRTIIVLAAAVLQLFAATDAFAQSQGPIRKPVVAVTQMKDMANTGQGAALVTMIQTAVTGTGKFRVIERDFGQLDTEQALANSGKVTTNTPGRVGGFAGIDFAIYGTITSSSGGKQNDTGANIGRAFAGQMLGFKLGGNCAKIVSSLAVDIKIVDTKTGEVAFAKQINQHTTTKTSCSNDPALDVASLMRDVANQTAMGLATTMYPMKVAAVQSDGTLILNYGEGALTPGLILAVYGNGTRVPDPDTGAMMTVEGPMLGTIRVSEVTTRFSKAVAVTPFATPPSVGSVVREAPPPPPIAPTKGKKH